MFSFTCSTTLQIYLPNRLNYLCEKVIFAQLICKLIAQFNVLFCFFKETLVSNGNQLLF